MPNNLEIVLVCQLGLVIFERAAQPHILFLKNRIVTAMETEFSSSYYSPHHRCSLSASRTKKKRFHLNLERTIFRGVRAYPISPFVLSKCLFPLLSTERFNRSFHKSKRQLSSILKLFNPFWLLSVS